MSNLALRVSDRGRRLCRWSALLMLWHERLGFALLVFLFACWA